MLQLGNEYPGERMSGLSIVWVNECLGGKSMGGTNVHPLQKSRGNECPGERLSVYRLTLDLTLVFNSSQPMLEL